MRVRSVLYASVCTAFLAASAAVGGGAAAAPNSPIDLTNDAYRSLMAGKTQEAISAYSEAIESRQLQAERLANALLNRGLAYQQIADTTRAIDDYTAALRIDALGAKLRAIALYNRGIAYQKARHPAMAIEDYTNALFLDPEFSHAYYSRANVLRDSGQYLFALSDYEKAIRYNHPQAYLVYYGEALTQEALKRPAMAQKALQLAIEANSSYMPARTKLAALGGVMPLAANPAADTMVTGSITGASPDQVVRKDILPAAVEPPAELVETAVVQPAAGKPEKPLKLFTDRVPEEEWKSSERVEVSAASEPARAAEPEPAKKVEEKIVAIEMLPEEEPAAKATAAEPAEAASRPEMAAKTGEADPLGETEAGEAAIQLSGWTIQLTSARDEKAAWTIWSKLKNRHKLLNDAKPVVIKADLGAKGIYYRLRLGGYDSQSDARSVCSKLKSRGMSCFVSKASS